MDGLTAFTVQKSHKMNGLLLGLQVFKIVFIEKERTLKFSRKSK